MKVLTWGMIRVPLDLGVEEADRRGLCPQEFLGVVEVLLTARCSPRDRSTA
jgi:hypothetical protein